jgi:RNA polymerase sigma factor (sigma-70 family)
VGLPPFQWFLDAHRDDVYRFLVASVGPHDADDCFQETFASALRAYPRLRADSNLRAWVLTIAHRKALDVHRARAARPAPVAAIPDGADPGDDGHREPALWVHVERLPPKQRHAVLCRYVSDLPFAEIGAAMGCSEEAARRSAHEGIKKLREVWR